MIPPEENDAGLLAYEQVLAYASLQRKKLPLIYACFDVALVLSGVILAAAGWIRFGAVVGAAAILFALVAWWNWKRLGQLDAQNRALLAQLQAKYGDDLPWLEVERQMAEIRQIEAERLPPPRDPPW